jgi:hypothetical protein
MKLKHMIVGWPLVAQNSHHVYENPSFGLNVIEGADIWTGYHAYLYL